MSSVSVRLTELMLLEEYVRYMLLLIPLVAAGCAQGYDAYGRPYGYSGSYPAYASGYGYTGGYYSRPYYGSENCGTPDEPKGCPPMPRVPLNYYPGDRW